MTVKLISITPDAEKTMAYVARVSNPANQDNENYAKLLAYCIKHNHWSVFEQSFMTLEIETNRGIAAQILRHRSFTYQEFSQRYADSSLLSEKIPVPELRRQDNKNRQNSIAGVFTPEQEAEWYADQEEVIQLVQSKVKKWRSREAAKECTRVFMPEGLTMSAMYMNGSVRTWIHYTGLRTERGVTQDEHCDIADAAKEFLLKYFPSLSKVLTEKQ